MSVGNAKQCATKASLRKRDAGGGDDAGEAEDFGIFFVGERRNGEARIFEEFDFAQGLLVAQLDESDLAREAFQRAQINDKILGARVVGVGIRVARDGGDGVERVLGLAVIAKSAVALFHQLQLAQSIGLVARVAPHLFALHEKGIPVIDAGINREQPVMGSVHRWRHVALDGLTLTGELYI